MHFFLLVIGSEEAYWSRLAVKILNGFSVFKGTNCLKKDI